MDYQKDFRGIWLRKISNIVFNLYPVNMHWCLECYLLRGGLQPRQLSKIYFHDSPQIYSSCTHLKSPADALQELLKSVFALGIIHHEKFLFRSLQIPFCLRTPENGSRRSCHRTSIVRLISLSMFFCLFF